MKNIKSTLYWIGFLAAYLAAFMLFGLIVAFVFKLPDNMVGGMLSYSLIICGLLFAADDETRELVKYIATHGERGNLPRKESDEHLD